MKKLVLSTFIGLNMLLSACKDYKTYIPPYEFRLSKNEIVAIENGRTIYYDLAPFGSLDALGSISTGGRAMGYTGAFLLDTSNRYFKNAADKYKTTIFPILPKKCIPK